MSSEFLELLVHPIYKTPLRFDEISAQLFDEKSNAKFNIKEGVPILVINNVQEEQTTIPSNNLVVKAFNYKDHYQTDAQVYDYGNEHHQHPVEQAEINFLRRYILSEIPQNALIVLDIGCGGAWLAAALLPTGKSVISTDISDINPIKATKKFPSLNHFGLVADVFELPIKANSIDCIVASEIIEHVPDPKRFIACLFEVLKPGGKIIITTPYNELIRTSLCIHCNFETPHNAHLHSFTEKNIFQLLPKVNKVKIQLLNSKLLVKTWVQYLLRFLPISLWKRFDKLVIFLTGKRAYRMMICLQK